MRWVGLVFVVACRYEPPLSTPLESGVEGDGGVDPDAPPAGPHLVMSEIYAESGADEFIEIHNPGSAAVSLDNVYLTDIANYWSLPSAPPSIANASDFLVRFPAGNTIAAGGIIVVAVDGPTFMIAFSTTPDYTIRTGIGDARPMNAIISPVGGAISDDGEMLVMFEWNGTSDRVHDLDIVVHGIPTAGNQLIAKAAVDGPDADTMPTEYATDANPTMTMSSRTQDGGGKSYQRLMLDEQEAVTGGNGISGHDETTEPLDTTWSSTGVANPRTLSF